MIIKDVCKDHPSDHYILTTGTIKHFGININGSTVEAYMQAQPQEICSFMKCVLPKHHKHNIPIINNWIVQKRKYNRVVKYEERFYFLDIMFNITPWNEQKFPEIVQRIYNAIFVQCLLNMSNMNKKTGKKSTWINDLNHEHKKELSKVVDKMQIV